MKSIIKVHPLKKQKDVMNIQRAISNVEGIIACEISIDKSEVQVIYNESCLELDDIIESIENVGYMVM